MAEFVTQCAYCHEDYTATRMDSRYCSGSHRAFASQQRRRDADLAAGLAAFRSSVASIIERMAVADGDPEILFTLGAEVASMSPASFAARRR